MAWNHVSASQIESFQKCKRSWFFKSIQKIQETQRGHQSLGTAFHLIMERVPQGLTYSREDVSASPEDWDKAEAMAKHALPLLPAESKPFKREHSFRMSTYTGGPTMVGYIDLAIPTGVGWPAFLVPANEAIVADYKTLSDFRYMKTPQELADSVQMMTYAKWALDEQQEANKDAILDLTDLSPVRLLHIYARSKAPFSRTSVRFQSAIVTPSEINTKWIKTLDVVKEMQQIATCQESDDVEANGTLTDHCNAYGGCSFRDRCGITPVSGIKSLFQIGKKQEAQENQNMSGSAILEKIKAARAAAQGQNPAAAQTASVSANGSADKPAEEGQQATKGPVSGLLAKITAKGQGQPTLAGAVAQAYGKEIGSSAPGFVGAGELGRTTVTDLSGLMRLASGIVPPDAPSRTQDVITRPGDTVADPLKTQSGTEEGEDDEEDNDSAPTTVVSGNASQSSGLAVSGTPGVLGSSDGAKKRGRPSKEEMAQREAAQRKAFEDAVNAEVEKRLASLGMEISEPVDSQTGEALEAIKAERNQLDRALSEAKSELQAIKANAAQKEWSAQQAGLTLYVDCYPTKGDKEVQDFFEWVGPICQAVAQANNVGDYRQINYTAKALLANAIREVVKAGDIPQSLTISSYAGGADVALEVLTPLAKRVIKKI